MDVRLRILQGRLKQGSGEEGVNQFKIRLRRFTIGSAPSCHMVCKSRTISERHCMILIDNGTVFVQDLASKAGTFINDVPVEATQVIRHHDKLRIGRLEFEVLIKSRKPHTPQAPLPPNQPEEVSIDTVVGSETVDTLVTDVLQQGDEAAREARLADPSARYFRADQIPSSKLDEEPAEPTPPRKERPKKQGVGKLPPPPPIKAEDTVSAAELALREIFHPSKGPGKS